MALFRHPAFSVERWCRVAAAGASAPRAQLRGSPRSRARRSTSRRLRLGRCATGRWRVRKRISRTPARRGGAYARGTVAIVDAALLPLLVGHARFCDVVLLRVLVHDLGNGRALDDAHGRNVTGLRAGGGGVVAAAPKERRMRVRGAARRRRSRNPPVARVRVRQGGLDAAEAHLAVVYSNGDELLLRDAVGRRCRRRWRRRRHDF